MHQVEALERRGWEALSGPDGASFYDDLMTDEGLMVFPGMALDKIATVRAIAGSQPWSSHRLDDVRLITSGDTAVITYHATAQREGEESYQARMSSVYARSRGRWQLILHQQTPDPSL